ncbi:nuclear transport factor 2 family protein [Parafrankia sp. EUN1f]|uniref:nuclear transport factor 2 family protein n=1 Tax=Parafrankia sp. EUN1f TaxID=102897 RepID=UPI0001C470E8|nr:nuclear transport factor 2 family protein [Parafrankia sp. EUN1f]EFC80006.1 hypothetical protein FrEUN1fDRAFT_6867 [Parafrankia sp. EUN1f]
MPHLTDATDRAELVALVSRLGRWLDDGDDEEGRDLFHKDAIVRSPRGTATGIDGIFAYVRSTSDDAERTQHLTTDILVEFDGDHATIAANELVAYFPSGQAFPSLLRLVGLRSAFRALHTQDGWRLTHVDITPLWRQEA